MLNLELFDKVHVFILKCLLAVMLFLIQNIVIHIFNLRMTVGKSAVPFLPIEFPFDLRMVIDEVRGVIFNIPNQIRECHCWF